MKKTKENKAIRGVSLVTHENLRKYITTGKPINERIIKGNISLHGNKLTITGVYKVNDDALVRENDELFQQIHEEIAEIGQSRKLILCGDILSRVGSKD